MRYIICCNKPFNFSINDVNERLESRLITVDRFQFMNFTSASDFLEGMYKGPRWPYGFEGASKAANAENII